MGVVFQEDGGRGDGEQGVVPVRRSGVRSKAFSVVMALLLVYTLSFFLEPDPSGVGTHTKLGLPACRSVAWFGVPCPFCGMTTSFALMAKGRFIDAFACQPAGALGFVVGIIALLANVLIMLTGVGLEFFTRFRRSALVFATVVLALSWIYKIIIYL